MYTKSAMSNEEIIIEIFKTLDEIKRNGADLSSVKISCYKQKSFYELLEEFDKTVYDLKNNKFDLSHIFITLKP